MDEIKLLRDLAETADKQEAVKVDVRRKVMEELQNRENAIQSRPLAYITAFCGVAATVAMAFSLSLLRNIAQELSWGTELMCLFND